MTEEMELWMMGHNNLEAIQVQRVNGGRFVIHCGKSVPCVVEDLADLQRWLMEFYRCSGQERRNEYRARTGV